MKTEKTEKTEKKLPVEFWTLDCETDPFEYGANILPFLWCIYTGSEFHLFEKTENLIEFIKDKHVKLYAHNGGKFDFHFLTDYIEPFSELLLIDGRIVKMQIGECQLFDSYSLIPCPLSAYKKDDFDYSKMEKKIRKKHIEEITAYLKNDCLYLYELLQKFFSDYGKNLTLASSAFKYWQKMEGELKPACGRELFDTIRPFYYGGRVECFYTGIINTPFQVIDINSAYPKAMLFDHPYGKEYFTVKELPKNKNEIERAFITLDCFSKGALPRRVKSGLEFPHEHGEYKISGWEYLTALKLGLISDIKIKEVILFCDKRNFRNYVAHFFDKKLTAEKTGDKGGRMIAKLFLNGLYGKFAMNAENHKKTFAIPSEFLNQFLDTDFRLICETGNGCSIIECDIDDETAEKKYINAAISASITGFVRAFLLESMHACETVYYCDTDSIACKSTGKLLLSDKIGDWKLEGEFKRGAIAGKKLYAFIAKDGAEKIASKGVKLSAKEIFSIARGKTIEYKKDSPSFSLHKKRETDKIKVIGKSAYITRSIKCKM